MRPRLLRALLRLLSGVVLAAPVLAAPQRSAPGGVVHEARWIASDAQPFDELGTSAALAEHGGLARALVGAPRHAHGASGSGAGYVLVRAAGAWVEEAELLASDAAADDELGTAAALDARTGTWIAALGAPLDDDRGDASGSVHVFRLEQGAWLHEAKLVAPEGAAGDRFGAALALAGDTLAVGARQADHAGAESGSVWIFRRGGTSWSLEARVEAPDAAGGDLFGSALALAGEGPLARLAVGAPLDDDGGSGAGSVHVFARASGSWSAALKLVAAAPAAGDALGSALALLELPEETLLLAGAPGADLLAGGALALDAGRVHVFRASAASWSEEARLAAVLVEPGARFGSALALASAPEPPALALALVGAPQAAPLAVQSGAAHAFARDASGWRAVERLVAPGGGALDRAGSAVAAAASGLVLVGSSPDSHAGPDPGALDAWRWSALVREACGAAPCPCGASALPGHGCAPADAVGPRLSLVAHEPDGQGGGSARLVLRGLGASGAPAVVLFRGAARLEPPAPFGDGLLCVGGALVRVSTTTASGGSSSHALAHGAGPGQFAYQAWFRAGAGACGAGFSTSNALLVRWP